MDKMCRNGNLAQQSKPWDEGETMTKRELIDSYTRGELDRRGFIRGLTALGVGAAAAATYAVRFGPSVAASPSTGFVMRSRLQDAAPTATDEEYGTAITLESDEQGIQIAYSVLAETASLLAAGLAEFTSSDFTDAGFPDDTFDLLTKIQQQIADQLDALEALGIGTPAAGGAAATATTNALTSPQDFLDALAAQLDKQAAAYAAIAPALEDGEARQTVTNIGFVTARQAATVHMLAGSDPIPSAFEEPALP